MAKAPDLLQLGQCQRTAYKKRSCEAEIPHRAAQGLEQTLGSVTDCFATAGKLHGSCFLLAIEGTASALVSELYTCKYCPWTCSHAASSSAAIAACSGPAEHNFTEKITIKKQCSSISGIAQRVFLKIYNFITKIPKCKIFGGDNR